MYSICLKYFTNKDIFYEDFYDNTKINYNYKNYRMFSSGKINKKFDVNALKNIRFKGCLYEVKDLICDDEDEYVGDYIDKILLEKLNEYSKQYKKYYIVRMSNPYNERKIIDVIKNEDILYELKGKQHIFILKSLRSEILKRYVEGYLFGDNVEYTDWQLINCDLVENIENIEKLLCKFSIVVLKRISDEGYDIIEYSVALDNE